MNNNEYEQGETLELAQNEFNTLLYEEVCDLKFLLSEIKKTLKDLNIDSEKTIITTREVPND